MSQYDEYNPFAGEAAQKRLPDDAGASPYDVVLDDFRKAITGQFTPAQLEMLSPDTERWIHARGLEELIRSYNDLALSNARPTLGAPDEVMLQRLLNDIFGLGGAEELLKLPDVEDVAINGPDDVWIRRQGQGGWEPTEVRFPSSRALLVLLNRAIVHTGRQAGPGTPIVDAHLRGGDRINIVTEPLADPWPAALIRRHRESKLNMEDLVAKGGGEALPAEPRPIPDYFAMATAEGVFSPLAATFLHMAVVAGLNILVIGATGVGKTTLLGALGRIIPPERRVVVIEDTRELKMRSRVNGRALNCVYFTTRAESVEGTPPIGQEALVRTALRQRPDALTLGEARGAEAFDLLKALWTGHKNGLTSIHADSLAEVTDRIRMMLQEAQFTTEVSEETVALWIAKAFHLGVMLRMTESGRRYVEEIAAFTGAVEGRMPARTILFSYVQEGRRGLALRSGALPKHHELMLRQAGYSFDLIREAAGERGEFAR